MQIVITSPTDQNIIAFAAIEPVIAAAAINRLSTRPAAGKGVVPGSARQVHRRCSNVENIVTRCWGGRTCYKAVMGPDSAIGKAHLFNAPVTVVDNAF